MARNHKKITIKL